MSNLRIEKLREVIVTHDMTNTSEYQAWEAMIQRCTNKNSIGYNNYGGRGIVVDSSWIGRGGFINFYKDVGNKPYENYSLDRIDPNGNYCKENCRWADKNIQSYNTRKSKNNTSGRTGVSWDKSRNMWAAYIMVNYKKINLGRYHSKDDAIKVRSEAELKYYGFNKE